KHPLVVCAGLVWVGATVLVAQTASQKAAPPAGATKTAAPQAAPVRLKPDTTTAKPTTPAATTVKADTTAPSPADAAKYQAWVKQYCVACHSNRVQTPANNPVNLETASLTDPIPHAGTWERVLRKLAVRAMPPQGTPHPAEAEYAAFTSWLSASLDRAWEGKATPGKYVVHRLNRAEYRNAIRDLLALD